MLDTVFMQILDMTKTASIVILFILLARLLLKKAPKIFSYALWAVVLFRLLCPVSIELPVSVVPKFEPTANSYTLENESITVFGASEAAYKAVGDALNGGIDSQIIRTTERDEEGNTEYTNASWWEVWILFGQYVWLTGIAGMVIYSIVSYYKLRRKLIGAVPLRDNIFLSDYITSPFVMGLFRPKIYLPSTLSESEQEYIILHEQHHIRRLDHIIKALSFAALCIHWFNPLVWLSFVLSGKDMEMSCDEAVIKKMGTDIRADYSASLLSLATGRRIIAGTPLAFGEGDTKGRIKNLAGWKKPAFWVILVAVVLSIALAVCFITDPVNETNGGKNYISVNKIDEAGFPMEEIITGSEMLTVKKGDTAYYDATAFNGRSDVIELLDSLMLGKTSTGEINYDNVDGCITVKNETLGNYEIYFAEGYSRLWIRSLTDTSYSGLYVVLTVEKAKEIFEIENYAEQGAIWEYNPSMNTYGHHDLRVYVSEEYELLDEVEFTGGSFSCEYIENGISWVPGNMADGNQTKAEISLHAVRDGEQVDFKVTITKVGKKDNYGTYFWITADDETVLGSYGNGYEYVLGKVETKNSESNTTTSPVEVVTNENGEIKSVESYPEYIGDNKELTLLKEEIPNANDWKTNGLKSAGIEAVEISEAKNCSFGRVYMLYNNFPSENYRQTFLAVETQVNVFLKEIGASYENKLSLYDVDGESGEEIVINQLVSASGGAGAYNSSIYKVTENGITELYYSSASEEKTNGFSSRLEPPFTLRITNDITGYETVLDYKDEKGYVGGIFDEAGNAIDEYGFSEAMFDSFYEFEPKDTDGDGVYEIECMQYTSLYGHADYIGSARSLLKYDINSGEFKVIEADFIVATK